MKVSKELVFSSPMWQKKLDTAIANLELLKNDKPPTELSKFQTKFKSSYDEEKKILLNGKNNSQEVSLKDNSKVQISVSFFQDF